jgi:dTDP-4-dehydrorhamnose 3,5-epimerase
MVITETAIPGCLRLTLPRHADDRGSFTKTFQRSVFREAGLPAEFVEQFHSQSSAGVIRGLHFQEPPHELAKLVTCIDGLILDVIVDLRVGSPTFGEHVALDLSSEDGDAILAPVGCAHGFFARTDSIVGYWQTAEYAPSADTGIRWDSAGIAWPQSAALVVSARDRALPTLSSYDSPFRFHG